jgi:quinol monooxygenase YgiN
MKTSNHRLSKAAHRSFKLLVFCAMLLLSLSEAEAQKDKRMIRLATIEVDTAQLKAYNAALLEQMHTAIRLEPGVLIYYAVADKKEPSRITILEIYADTTAYQKHLATAHFRKYKATVEHMVKKLQLVEVNLIGSAKQPGL